MTETSNTLAEDPITRGATKRFQPLPRNLSRFQHLSPDPCPQLRPDAPNVIEPRLSLQMALEGHNTPNWLQPGPYRPKNLTEVCADGDYRHAGPAESS